MKKYYHHEHETTYKTMQEQGLQAWDQFHEPEKYTFDKFMMRPFLEYALTVIKFNTPKPKAFEYGCGTGTSACFLASKGFEVEAIDICQTAIELAKKFAAERSLKISYEVKDITEIYNENKQYDLVTDNYCLQSVVTDADRKHLFSNVLKKLKYDGYYLIATAIFNSERDYSDCYFDSDSGIVYERVNNNHEQYNDSIKINDFHWIPNRRHLTSSALYAELTNAGFKVIYQNGGNLICKTEL